MEIVIASRNLHKIREIRQMLACFPGLDILSLIQFPNYVPKPSIGKTFKDNATQKALHAAKSLNKWVLADDSGLVIPSLNGAPGIHGNTYAGEDATDEENRQKLLSDMKGKEDLDRSAYLECALALASPGKLIKCVTGCCEGTIVTQDRGRNGFSYDALFVKGEYDKTFAEIDDTTKNRISHRRKALEKLFPTLEKLCITSSTPTT